MTTICLAGALCQSLGFFIGTRCFKEFFPLNSYSLLVQLLHLTVQIPTFREFCTNNNQWVTSQLKSIDFGILGEVILLMGDVFSEEVTTARPRKIDPNLCLRSDESRSQICQVCLPRYLDCDVRISDVSPLHEKDTHRVPSSKNINRLSDDINSVS